jgi:hypothetical protein
MNWTSDDRRTLTRAIACSVALVIVVAALVEIPPLSNLRTWGSRGVSGWVLLTLVPQALVIAITVGATLGIVYAIGGQAFSGRVAGAIVGLALVASALSFANLGWIMPAANQAFRVALVGGRTYLRARPAEPGELREAIEMGDRGATAAGVLRRGVALPESSTVAVSQPLGDVVFAHRARPADPLDCR